MGDLEGQAQLFAAEIVPAIRDMEEIRNQEMETIAEQIRAQVASWDGVTVEPHRFGGIEFRANHHEIGHLHGSRLADLPFPVQMRKALVGAGRASPHHILPETGWVSFWIRGDEDVPAVVELFRLNYQRVMTGRRTVFDDPGGKGQDDPPSSPDAVES